MDPQVAVASARDSPGHHGLDLLRHYTDIDFVAPDVTETIEAKSNHCQPTSIKIILADNPLRDTVNAAGPYDLESMFETGRTIIEDVASAAESLSKAAPTPVSALETSATGREPMPQVMASRGTKRRTTVRLALGRSADKPARYPKESAGIGVGGPIIAIEGAQRTPVGPASETRPPHQRAVKDHPRREGRADAILRQEGKARDADGRAKRAGHRGRGEPTQVEIRPRISPTAARRDAHAMYPAAGPTAS